MTRIVAIDPGTARIGVAVSDSSRIMAFPRPYIARDPHWVRALVILIREEDADTVLIGVPVTLSGDATAAREAAHGLRHEILAEQPTLSVDFADERFTTAIAASSLRDAGVSARNQREFVDSAAAVVLLQGYLNAQAH
jgi:putative Holliday junction resolvase